MLTYHQIEKRHKHKHQQLLRIENSSSSLHIKSNVSWIRLWKQITPFHQVNGNLKATSNLGSIFFFSLHITTYNSNFNASRHYWRIISQQLWFLPLPQLKEPNLSNKKIFCKSFLAFISGYVGCDKQKSNLTIDKISVIQKEKKEKEKERSW